MNTIAFDRRTPGGAVRWTVSDPVAKLGLRAKLPGAFSFDRAAAAIATAKAAGAPAIDLLPLALPASWLVNNAAPSTVFKKWLAPENRPRWEALLANPRETEALAALALGGQGAGALSKVLALLLPEAVPLMPDAALAFALGETPEPDPGALDAQSAPIALFVPMLDWFGAIVGANEATLASIAAEDAKARAVVPSLLPAQVFDRLLWFESAGHRHFRAKTG